jgi:hypothetical protein
MPTRIGRREEARFVSWGVRSDYWLGYEIGVEDDRGTQYRVDAKEWATYFEYLSSWRWITTGTWGLQHLDVADYLKPVSHKAQTVLAAYEPIATTLFEKQIAVRVHLQAIRYTRMLPSMLAGIAEPDQESAEVVLNGSPVYWLPTPDRVSVQEAIDTILRHRYGISLEARVPDWVLPDSLPDQEPIATESPRLNTNAENWGTGSARHVAAPSMQHPLGGCYMKRARTSWNPSCARPSPSSVQASKTQRPKGSRTASSSVTRARRFWRSMGRNGPIKQGDVRQVVQWASAARLKDGVEYKPLIVGDPYCDRPLEERRDVLGPNAATYARNGGVRIITTAQLFEALRQKQSGTFDAGRFWETVFAASGDVRLDQPIADETPGRAES